MQYKLAFLSPPAPPQLPGLIHPPGPSLGPLAKLTPEFYITLAACRLAVAEAGKHFRQIRANTSHPPQRPTMAPELCHQARHLLLKCLRNPAAQHPSPQHRSLLQVDPIIEGRPHEDG
ncbi:hypothetical protein [Acidocella facilis]|uniref:hypothetical protein n=1 Tax=Acidocella facilis TaxID=525 RepID=UPI0012DC8902|nr:hypothetical protein [Acidocella facilis]